MKTTMIDTSRDRLINRALSCAGLVAMLSAGVSTPDAYNNLEAKAKMTGLKSAHVWAAAQDNFYAF